mgnify:CR=1 FL=1
MDGGEKEVIKNMGEDRVIISLTIVGDVGLCTIPEVKKALEGEK